MLTRLWCARLCGNMHTNKLKRFHFTCLYCRMRRGFYGKYTLPPYYIDYAFPWKIWRYALVKDDKILAYKTIWYTVNIDPRGHFTMLRCAVIVTFDKIMNRFRRTEKVLMSLCELLANYPTW